IAGLTNSVAGLAFALTDAALLFGAISKSRNFDVRERNFDKIFLSLSDHFAMTDEAAEILLDLARNNVAKPILVFFGRHDIALSMIDSVIYFYRLLEQRCSQHHEAHPWPRF